MRKRFSDEQIASANSKNIIEVAKSLGLNLMKEGRSYRVPGNGGFIITPEKNKFNCFSSSTGGGPIQLVMMVEDIPWVKAVAYLLGENIAEVSKREYKPVPKKEIDIPKKSENYRHMYAYLMKTRKIDKDIIDLFVKEHLLYENKYHSCVFVGYDNENKIKHCFVRGTTTEKSFKGEASGSDKKYAFHRQGITTTLRVFEAAIDSLSYLTMYHHSINDHILCLCCLSEVALIEYLKNHHIATIILQLDNDKWGSNFTEKLMEKYKSDYVVLDERPSKEYKDWNNYLTSLMEEKNGET